MENAATFSFRNARIDLVWLDERRDYSIATAISIYPDKIIIQTIEDNIEKTHFVPTQNLRYWYVEER